ncbi:MAG: hypothetical protein Q9186_001104 [Xanthomendoza sp. 1 TL-2023]
MDFHIETYFSREFDSEIGWGIMVGIKIDGGATYGYHWTKSQINRYQMSGSPVVFDAIEQSPTTRMAFRFGSMQIYVEGDLDENIDWALGEPESEVGELGTIEVEVVRVKYKRNTLPSEKSPRTIATSPRTAVDLSGTQIQDAEGTTDLSSTTGPHYHTSRDFKMLAEKVDGLEKQLKESQAQTAALMQELIGGVHSTIKAALEAQRTGMLPTISMPALSTPGQSSGVKRKHRKKTDRTEEVTPAVEMSSTDPSKRNYYGD